MSWPCGLRGGLHGQEGGAWAPGLGPAADRPPHPLSGTVSPCLVQHWRRGEPTQPVSHRSWGGPWLWVRRAAGVPQARSGGGARAQSWVRPRVTDGTQRPGLLGSRAQLPAQHVAPACVRPCRSRYEWGPGAGPDWPGCDSGSWHLHGRPEQGSSQTQGAEGKVDGGSCGHREEFVQRP